MLGAAGRSCGNVTPTMFTHVRPSFLPKADVQRKFESVIFGGGCFWGIENMMRRKFPSELRSTQVGYARTTRRNTERNPPTYDEVCTGKSGYFEAVRVEYYPDTLPAEDLFRFFWSVHDPTTPNRQGNDLGSQYRSALCVYTQDQLVAAQKVKSEMITKWGSPLTTEIVKVEGESHADSRGIHSQSKDTCDGAANQGGVTYTNTFVFWPAEMHHQLYLEKNPQGYCNHYNRFE